MPDQNTPPMDDRTLIERAAKAPLPQWKDLSPNTLACMELLGSFGPTTRHEEGLVKGSMYDPKDGEFSKTYLDSGELREMAAACTEVADWLDKRKAAALAQGE